MSDKSHQIHILDDLNPEDNAMLQALYSRSPASVVSHLEKVRKAGSGKFMSQFYVGYGHASIGDCGTTTIFIENYSMLVAKAIQDNQLYSGQEASTRYLDFSEQPLYNPFNTDEANAIQQEWLNIYNRLMPQVKAALKVQYPFDKDEYKSEKTWEGAINARAFDTLRSFLPVGSTTLLSWTTNLRQARDRLMRLRNHPLPEIQELARDVFAQLKEKYPNSFNGAEMDDNTRYDARHAFEAEHGAADHIQPFSMVRQRYQLTDEDVAAMAKGQLIFRDSTLDKAGLNRDESDALQARPKGANGLQRWKAYGQVNIVGTLDFGSFRDLQRHRGGVCMLPLIDNTFGFNCWYLDELERLLPEADFAQLQQEIKTLLNRIQSLADAGEDAQQLQYLYPMGMNICVDLSYTVPQMLYVAELRSGKTVHGSLRPLAQQMGDYLAKNFPNMALYVDYDEDNWSTQRGEQTITAKAG